MTRADCWFLGAICAALLGACATERPSAPPPAVAVACPPLKTYTPEEQKAVAAEMETLPPASHLAGFIIDYGKMREADRACLGR